MRLQKWHPSGINLLQAALPCSSKGKAIGAASVSAALAVAAAAPSVNSAYPFMRCNNSTNTKRVSNKIAHFRILSLPLRSRFIFQPQRDLHVYKI